VLNLAIAAVSTDKTLKELLIKCNMSAMKYLDSRSTSWSSVGAEIEFETENYEPFHDQTHASKVLEKKNRHDRRRVPCPNSGCGRLIKLYNLWEHLQHHNLPKGSVRRRG
jgi:hypothetical protein